MRVRTPLFSALALLLVSCGSPSAVDETTIPEVTTTAPQVEAALLSYTLEPGTTHTYEVDVDQKVDMVATGDAAAMGEEDVPGEMSLEMAGTVTLTHSVAAGPAAGTFEVTISGDYSDVEVTGTIDGEPVSGDDVPDFATLDPIDVTLIVDEQGNVIPEEGPQDGMLGALGGLGGFDALAQLGANGSLGQLLGPPLSDEEVTVGDTWSETIEVPTLPEDDPVTTVIESEVVGAEELDGHDVLVIDTVTTTSPIDFDLAELLLGFMFAFSPEEATDEELAEMEALADELRFAFHVDETVTDMTSRFDPEAGLSRQGDTSTAVRMVFDIKVPDEETGELVAFAMDMTMSVNHSYRLVGSTPA